jgi:fluoroquinolone transport system permease protein
MMQALRALAATDARNISRDALLRFLLLYPFILGFVARWLLPIATEGLAEQHVDLVPHYNLIIAYFGILITPQLGGLVIGFLLLDERDDRTLSALQATPLSMNTYLAYRLAIPVLVSFGGTYLVLWLMNVGDMPYGKLLPIALLAALEGPIFGLMLVAVAKNKVQGLALMKGLGIFTVAPIAAWFVAEPWQYLFGLIFTYWPAKAFWQAMDGEPMGLSIAIGLVLHLVILALLLRRFNRVLYR